MPQDAPPPTQSAHALRPVARLILGLVLLSGLAVGVPPAHAGATWSPDPPSGEYTPHRVWQMKRNCVWAAGAMLLDKWTHGGIRVSQSVLRRAANDKKGGSNLYDLSRGVAAVTGIRIRFSPGFGDTMTWWQLLDRIEHDGGAVLVGDYGRLPAHFTRWSTSFATRRDSSHAVYVQSYDRVHGKVWLMDPLAEGHYPGEWIDVEALHRFAAIDEGAVMAAATPVRHQPQTAPLTDHAYRLTSPRLAATAVAGSTVKVSVGLSITAGFPSPAAHRLVATWLPVAAPRPSFAPLGSQALVEALSARDDGTPLPVEATTASDPDRAGPAGFDAAVPVPAVPGRYRVGLGLVEVGRKTAARTFAPVAIEVVGPYAGNIGMPALAQVSAGDRFGLRLGVANIGTLDWRPPAIEPDGPRAVVPPPQTVLVLTWRASGGAELPAAELPAELAPGQAVDLRLVLVAPPDAGTWTLVGDVISRTWGPLSSTGRELPTMTVIVDPKVLSSEP